MQKYVTNQHKKTVPYYSLSGGISRWHQRLLIEMVEENDSFLIGIFIVLYLCLLMTKSRQQYIILNALLL